MAKHKVYKTYPHRKCIIITLFVLLFIGFGFSILNEDLFVDGLISVGRYEETLQPGEKYLYNILSDAFEEEGSPYIAVYEGASNDSIDTSLSTKSIYSWEPEDAEGAVVVDDMYNLIFANYCWKILRTTDTGGVRLLYNGEAENNQCLADRGTHVGYYDEDEVIVDSLYYYGDGYQYDKTNNIFTLTNPVAATWSDSTYSNLIGKYTCLSSEQNGTCSTLYFVESYVSNTTAYLFKLDNSVGTNIIGESTYNSDPYSMSAVGYMYNKTYPSTSIDYSNIKETILYSYTVSGNYWYSDDISYDPDTGRYSLVDPVLIDRTTNFDDVVGKYTFMSTVETQQSGLVYYASGNYQNGGTTYRIYAYEFRNGMLPTTVTTYTFGDSYTDNGDGTYTINSPTVVKANEWYSKRNSGLTHKYICKNAVNNTCSDLWLLYSPSTTYLYYFKKSDYNDILVAESFNYSDGKYHLTGETHKIWEVFSNTTQNYVNTNGSFQYTCLDTSTECTNLAFINYTNNNNYYTYITLSNGESKDDAFANMLSVNDLNTVNSTIKNIVDEWYRVNLLSYGNMIENSVYCGDRSLYPGGVSDPGWVNGGSITISVTFPAFRPDHGNFECSRELDRYSVDNPKAKLTYPIALISSNESFNQYIRAVDGVDYWVSAPHDYSYLSHARAYSSRGGVISSVGLVHGVRPSITLKYKTKFSSGDGSKANPFIVNTN